MNYFETYRKFINGEITQEEWARFCIDYFYNVIMTDVEVMTIFKRLKNT